MVEAKNTITIAEIEQERDRLKQQADEKLDHLASIGKEKLLNGA